MGEGKWKKCGEEERREGCGRREGKEGREGGREKEELCVCVCVCEGGREERQDKEFYRVDMQRKTLP